MTAISTIHSFKRDLLNLGVSQGDGLFVHGSMKAIGVTVGGPRMVVQALLEQVGKIGLVGMPGFSTDAYFPPSINPDDLSADTRAEIERAVPGFDPRISLTEGVGVIAETFRTWPKTVRSAHPTTSVCLNGLNAQDYISEHALAWATGENTPFGKLYHRTPMKILLIGVGWNRCTPLHTAEYFAKQKRSKVRRFKNGGIDGAWMETPDVADDLNRLFPAVGKAFEDTGGVVSGRLGGADCKVCDYKALVDFASQWISNANEQSGDRH